MADLKKMWTAMAASLVAVSGIVSAAGPQYAVDCVQPTQPCELPCNPCNPCDTGCGRWAFDVELLYWTACEGGLTYGSESEGHTFGTSTSGAETEYFTKKKHPHTRWDLGWRLGIGYQFPCECWDATLIWTHFDTDAHGSHDEDVSTTHWFTPAWGGTSPVGVAPQNDGPLFGGNTPPNGTDEFPVDEAHAHWKLRLNLLDLEIGREFCVNSCLTLRPFVGVRGASINEKYDLEYEAIPFLAGTTTSTSYHDDFRLKNDFEGAGVRGGLDTNYDLGCGVSIYGGVAASLLYGETEIKTKEFTTTAIQTLATGATVTNVVEHEQRDRDCGVRAVTDAEIGFRWQHCCCDKIIVMQFGWEHHFFFNQNQFEKFTDYAGFDNFATNRYPQDIHGDLSIQGLVLSARVHF